MNLFPFLHMPNIPPFHCHKLGCLYQAAAGVAVMRKPEPPACMWGEVPLEACTVSSSTFSLGGTGHDPRKRHLWWRRVYPTQQECHKRQVSSPRCRPVMPHWSSSRWHSTKSLLDGLLSSGIFRGRQLFQIFLAFSEYGVYGFIVIYLFVTAMIDKIFSLCVFFDIVCSPA